MQNRKHHVLTRLIAVLVVLISCLCAPTFAEAQTYKFTRSADLLPNPERGWWTYADGRFQDLTDARAAQIAKDGYRVIVGVVRLDDYRNGPLPSTVLTSLTRSFGYARKNGLKVILRFAYNFPLNDTDSGADAPLNTVLGHIMQIGPIVTSNADTIVAMQGGFIGAWGEGHSSTNDLDTAVNKAKVRDAIYAAVPKTLNLQWRYPRDIVSWSGDTRMGLHNDCFLADPSDAGTYWGDAATNEMLRTAMKKLTARTFFSGETCNVNSKQARMSCTDILAEGAAYHLASLNRNFYTAFHDRWKAEGCFDKVARKMGYDLRLVDLVIGKGGSVTLRVANSGWASPIQPRSIVVTTFAGGKRLGQFALKGKLSAVLPSTTRTFTGAAVTINQAQMICISAPDTSARLAKTPAYSVRFANANVTSQAWNPTMGAFCISGIKPQR